VTARQTFAQSDLALSGKITVRGIEIIEACVDKGIDHLREFGVVNVAVFKKRQSHTAEAKILFDFGKHRFIFLSLTVTGIKAHSAKP
jgi:hypothetical protein